MKKFILFFIMTLISWVSFGQFVGVLASTSNQGGGTVTIDYSLANASHGNLFHDIDKTATGVDGEPEVIDSRGSGSQFWIGRNGATYEYGFTEGDVGSLTITSPINTGFTNQSRNLFEWRNGGLNFTTANFAENVYSYSNVSVAYDISSSKTYDGLLFNLTAQDADGRGYAWNEDGTKFWMVGRTNGAVYEYDIVPAFSGSTSVTFVGSHTLGSGSAFAGATLSPDGKHLIICVGGSDTLRDLEFTTAGTLLDGVTETSLDVDWWVTTPYNIKYSEDGKFLYFLDTSKDEIQQVNLNNQNTYSAELFTNSDFASATGWTLGSGWSVSGGQATHDGSATATISQTVSVTAGKWYVVEVEVASNSQTATNPQEASGQSLWSGARFYDDTLPAGRTVTSFKATSTGNSTIQLYGRFGAGLNLILNSFSIREVTN